MNVFGDDGGVDGYTLHGPVFARNHTAYKRVTEWPRAGIKVKWIDAKKDFVIMDQTMYYASKHQGASYGCKRTDVNAKLNILR